MKNKTLKAYGIWAIGFSFYLYQYFIRAIPSVIMHDLEITFSSTAAQVATAVGMYLLVYAPLQLIVGVLFSSFGVRKIFIHASTLLTLSCLLPLIQADTLFYFGLGRALMGLTSAFSFVGVMYLCTLYFPKEKLALLSGLTSGLGVFGAITAQLFLPELKTHYGYNNIWLISILFGTIVSLLVFKFIPKTQTAKSNTPTNGLWHQCKHQLGVIGKQWQTWNISILSGALYMPFAVFADFFSIPYFTQICHFSVTQAGILTSILNLTWAISSPIVGWISDKFNTRKAPLVISGFAAAFCFTLLLLLPNASFVTTAFIAMVIGICCGGQAIGFVAGVEIHPEEMHASSIAFINMIIMLFCGVAQVIIGHIVSACHQAFSLTLSYQIGLGFISITLLVSSIIFILKFKQKQK